jgi:hypothetical protein
MKYMREILKADNTVKKLTYRNGKTKKTELSGTGGQRHLGIKNLEGKELNYNQGHDEKLNLTSVQALSCPMQVKEENRLI